MVTVLQTSSTQLSWFMLFVVTQASVQLHDHDREVGLGKIPRVQRDDQL